MLPPRHTFWSTTSTVPRAIPGPEEQRVLGVAYFLRTQGQKLSPFTLSLGPSGKRGKGLPGDLKQHPACVRMALKALAQSPSWVFVGEVTIPSPLDG